MMITIVLGPTARAFVGCWNATRVTAITTRHTTAMRIMTTARSR